MISLINCNIPGKIFTAVFILFFFIGNVNAQSEKEKATILQHTKVKKLQKRAHLYSKQAKEEKEEAIKMAKKKGWIIKKKFDDGRVMELQRVEDGEPIYYITYNIDAAGTISTNEVWSGGEAGLELNGSGLTAGVWDGGKTRITHQEFEGRAIQQDGAVTADQHATHVSGTVIAGGVDPNAKGMAHEASLDAYDWNSDLSEMTEAASNGLLISNHSYGIPAGWVYNGGSYSWNGDPSISEEEDYKFGFYNYECRSWDELAKDAPYYQMVVAAGNDRNEGPGNGEYPNDGEADGGYDCISGKALAKNVIAVGAVEDMSGGYQGNPSDVESTSFSSWGPADDGRVKPDISANGAGLYSTSSGSDSEYASLSGTSMASPSVTGSLLLLQEHYNEVHGEFMKAATLKGLIIHTADEAGANDGPDYKFGWGLMNTQKAADIITRKNNSSFMMEETLMDDDTSTYQVYSEGNSPLIITMTWTDPAGSPVSAQLDPTDPMLVNDLDLKVIGPSGNVYQPYMLDPANPSAAATTGNNNVDNVEKIVIDAPESGIYDLVVSHKSWLNGNSQDFSMIISDIVAKSPGNFNANPLDNRTMELTWDKNIDNDNVMVVASPGEFAGSPEQGTSYAVGDSLGNGKVLYIGADTSFVHEHLQSGTYYYYNAWSVDGENNYSTPVETSARTQYDIIFADGFETNKGWTLTGEFERTQPQGLGGSEGNPDPSSAYEGEKVLGTDLTGLGGSPGNPEGDYAGNLGNRAYQAVSPEIDCENYTEVHVNFARWLNIEEPYNDSAHIDISTDGGDSWQSVWFNDKEYTEDSWSSQTLDISELADDSATVKLRYTLGETDAFGGFYSGWNIDQFEITGKIPRYEVTYHVTDGSNPVEDAYVDVDDQSAFTDANGYVSFNGIRKGEHIYNVRKTGFENATDTLQFTQDDTIEVVMNPGTATYDVSFVVKNGNEPVPGASVDFNSETLTTDVYGKAEFNGIEAGDYAFTITKDGHVETGNVTVIDQNIDTTVYFTYNVSFTIDDGTNPIEDATVNLQGYGDSLTDASGQVIFEHVMASSDITYEVNAEGYVKEIGSIDVVDTDVSKSVSLTPGTQVHFTVKNNEDQLIEGATVGLSSEDTVTTDAQGEVSVYLVDGEYSYSVSAQGHYSNTGNFTVAGTDVAEEVTLDKIYTITFALDDGANPIESAEVDFEGNLYTTNSTGEVSLDTSAGTYNYSISKVGYYGSSGSVSISDADVQKTITISRINTITFEVREGYQGLENAQIDFAGRMLQTNTSGEASIDTANGTYNFKVTKEEYSDYSGSVEVFNNDTSLVIELEKLETGIGDLSDNETVIVYPNPTEGKIFIEGKQLKQAEIILRNVIGNQMMRQKIQQANKITIDLRKYPKGIYFISIHQGDQKVTRKIIFQ